MGNSNTVVGYLLVNADEIIFNYVEVPDIAKNAYNILSIIEGLEDPLKSEITQFLQCAEVAGWVYETSPGNLYTHYEADRYGSQDKTINTDVLLGCLIGKYPQVMNQDPHDLESIFSKFGLQYRMPNEKKEVEINPRINLYETIGDKGVTTKSLSFLKALESVKSIYASDEKTFGMVQGQENLTIHKSLLLAPLYKAIPKDLQINSEDVKAILSYYNIALVDKETNN